MRKVLCCATFAGDGEGRGDMRVAERRRKVETSGDCRAAGELGDR